MKDVVTTREEQDDGGLTLAQRWSRAADFYKDAVPVLMAYLALEKQLQFEREVLHRTVSKVDEDRRYNALHDWGSVRITDAIMRLKGFYVKTGQVMRCTESRYLYTHPCSDPDRDPDPHSNLYELPPLSAPLLLLNHHHHARHHHHHHHHRRFRRRLGFYQVLAKD